MYKIPCEKCGSPDRANCNCGWTSDPNLTFAAAMALARDWTPLECCGKDSTTWVPFDTKQTVRFDILASWSFRRARLKRSRVQEMAEATAAPGFPKLREEVMTAAIRAVCEYLRSRTPYTEQVPADIERHFLEPR